MQHDYSKTGGPEMLSDIDIARAATMQPIADIAQKLGIEHEELIPYGKHMAKVSMDAVNRLQSNPKRARLVLVTAVNPTPAGEGKTTTSVGLADGLARVGKRVAVALREPSLGPVFGVKGGAAGGGYAQVVPMEELNLHFTGDIHAVTAANNLLAAMLDNHIFHGNEMCIDPAAISWRRVMDMNDRQLRQIECGLGKNNGVPRFDGFDITAASEVMAVLCLAKDLDDLKKRLGNIVVARDTSGKPVTAAMLHAHGAMAVMLKDAIQPNLVQTLEGTPVFVHGGPFANIAHGCNSIIATKTAMAAADWVVTEAGFGADLGAEKFLDIKCRAAGLWPSAVVIVATVRALKYHSGITKDELKAPNAVAVQLGMCNLLRHIRNLKALGLPVVVSLNHFTGDTEEEQQVIIDGCAAEGVPACRCTAWGEGGAGAVALANAVTAAAEQHEQKFVYDTALPIREKVEALVRNWYRGGAVEYSPAAAAEIDALEAGGYGGLPICMAKTQYSVSDDAKAIGAPEGFTLKVRSVRLLAGAGFIVLQSGSIMTMPGLSKLPAAEQIDIDEQGNIVGLF
jgi:formate--tetrahydrofolate ligase